MVMEYTEGVNGTQSSVLYSSLLQIGSKIQRQREKIFFEGEENVLLLHITEKIVQPLCKEDYHPQIN